MKQIGSGLLEELRKFDTPTICNAVEAFGIRPRTEGFTGSSLVKRTGGRGPLVGFAATGIIAADAPAERRHRAALEAYYAQYVQGAGNQIAVIHDADTAPVGSFWGDVQATVHQALGCIGAITDGGVRDLAGVEETGFAVWAKHILISHAHVHMIEAGGAVTVCGMRVQSGDLIHADVHGAICIPQEIAPYLPEACVRAAKAEEALLLPCREALRTGRTVTAGEIMAWRDEMMRRRESIDPRAERWDIRNE